MAQQLEFWHEDRPQQSLLLLQKPWPKERLALTLPTGSQTQMLDEQVPLQQSESAAQLPFVGMQQVSFATTHNKPGQQSALLEQLSTDAWEQEQRPATQALLVQQSVQSAQAPPVGLQQIP